MCIDSIKDSLKLSFDSWSTDRKTVDAQLEYQAEAGSAQNKNSPKKLKVINQSAARIGVPHKTSNRALSDILNFRKYHVDIDGVRYPRDIVSIDYASNDYVDQYTDLKLFYKEYIGEEVLNPFIRYTAMKNKNPIQVTDPRF